jgi:hypothetical protein
MRHSGAVRKKVQVFQRANKCEYCLAVVGATTGSIPVAPTFGQSSDDVKEGNAHVWPSSNIER